ncbi:TonB-dependent receptor [Ectothiorhodospira haloalkaliphila]|uniref:TonB-dependent receptor n=2 Tax=Ectothiorhodospira TaxID=1051 RepID=UPI001EE8CA06|nr:TonB-dependent receptor [Ectothiorhodospira haloalkaliphila]MCG5525383.1 TonB-dependent receptor [Ectothiorhodospira haloalkaliphila]
MPSLKRALPAAVLMSFSMPVMAQDMFRDSQLPGARLAPLPLGGTHQVTSGSAFNPDISVIVDTVYFNEFSGHVDDPAGFEAGHDHGHGGHDHGHDLDEGFNLREIELAFSASVDNYFDAFVMLALDEHDIEVEEAYATTRNLPAGLQIKAGKFLSDIGYINSQHPHDWAFVDRPLVNEFLFGDHGLQETGVQLTWMPATQTYTRFGIELLQGETSGIANYEGSKGSINGQRRILKDSSGPRLVTAFAKFGPDLGFDHAAQFGISGGYASTFQKSDEHSTRHEDWDGTAWFAGLDGVYKYDAGRSFGHGDWTLQGEYFYREIDVDRRDVNFEADGNGPAGFVRNEQSFKNKQDGLYLQAIHGIAPRWQAGFRAEALGLTNDIGRGDGESFGTSYRYAGNVTFRPTEFSMLRGQVNRSDFATEDGDDGDGWSFMLQFQMALGVHGAHEF